ncbi:MAG: DUF1801 domain-containing protein [Ignavibacteria bacterium]|nr:DUF1801 domain-containing protein [Ignavibacteria bacterium]
MDIKEFINSLPEAEKQITTALRKIVLDVNPSFEEKFAYGVPYFYTGKRVCFIWPSSVPRSGFKTGVMFGLCNGVILKKKFDIISCGSCKVIGWLRFHKLSEIKPKIIKDILLEAIIFQEMQNLLK